MADSVRRVLEEMVPELEELEKRGYFDKHEIKSLVRMREKHEYNLQRRAALKKDYLRCIEYEKSLERLQTLRKRQRNIEAKNSVADHCIVRRIHRLYDRMVKKFKGDLLLWNDWIKFCEVSRSSKQMSKVLVRALQLHPNCAALWIYAAAWEFEHNHNAVAARSLMQRGLRMCKNDPLLWLEYFRMELLYAGRLFARRKVLGLEENAMDNATRSLLSGAVAKVVYTNATQVMEKDAAVWVKFLNILAPVDILAKRDLSAFIWDDVIATFGHDPVVAIMHARKYLEELSAEHNGPAADAILESLVVFPTSEYPSTDLFRAKLVYLEEKSMEALEDSDGDTAQILINEYIKVGEDAVSNNACDPEMILNVSRAYLRLGRYSESIHWLGKHPEISDAIEKEKINLMEYKAMGEGKDISSDIVALVKSIPGESRRPNIWFSAINLVIGSNKSVEALANLFIEHQRASVKGSDMDPMGQVGISIINALLMGGSPEAARSFYKEALAIPLPGANFIRGIARLEISLLHSKSPSALLVHDIRKIYDAGVDCFGSTSVALWLDYYQFEVDLGKQGKGGMVHWRALQNLDDADAFIGQAQMLTTGVAGSIMNW